MLNSPLGGRYGIGGALGRSWKREAGGELSGWWNNNGAFSGCIAAYQPKGAASYAASKVNLTGDATYNAVDPAGAVGWNTTDGWIGGSSKYISTGYVISDISHSVFIRFTDAPSAATGIVGTYNAANASSLYIRPNSSFTTFYYYASNSFTTLLTTAGTLGLAGKDCYKNGSDIGDLSQTGTSAGPHPLFIFAINLNGSPGQYFTGKIQAFALYSVTLTTSQAADLHTAMAAL